MPSKRKKTNQHFSSANPTSRRVEKSRSLPRKARKEAKLLNPTASKVVEKVLPAKQLPAPGLPLKFHFKPKPLSSSPLRRMAEGFEMALARPKVSVVIPNHNGVDALWHCLFALKTQTYPPSEIILVDNASQDASVSFVKNNYPQVKILECQEDFGPAMASNLGAKMATGHLVTLISPDVVLTPDWLSRMVRDFRENWPRFGALVSPLRTNPATEGNWDGTQTLNLLGSPVMGFFQDAKEVFCPQGGLVLYPRFLAPEGPFDPDYVFSQEDVYLGWKFRLAELPSALSTTAKAFQKPSPSMDLPEWKSFFFQTRNRWLNLLLFYEDSNLLKISPLLLGEALLGLLKSLGTGFSRFFGTLCAMGWILLHPANIQKRRRLIQEKRKASDGEILKCLSGRVMRDGGIVSRVLNFFSLAYCRLVGLGVLEWQE